MHEESTPASAGQADESITGNDDVVENGDAAEFADLPKSGGQFQILARRSRIPRRVVVAEDDRSGGAANEGAKHVARMHLDPGQRSSRNASFEQDAMAHIERQHPEFLDR